MKGDFTRKTFDPRKHYSRVLSQQGRVTVDADPSEQADILLHYLRTLAADLIGPCAAPFVGGGFALSVVEKKLMISPGRYYVDGILVENEAECSYAAQPSYYPLPPEDTFERLIAGSGGKPHWLYLDVWERHITFIEDVAIREVALGGPDTCTRSKVIWQVKAKEVDEATAVLLEEAVKLRGVLEGKKPDLKKQLDASKGPARVPWIKALADIDRQLDQLNAPACMAPVNTLAPLSDAAMAAWVDPGFQSDDPCVLSPAAKYRGTENHLYRVEIHHGSVPGPATFKWSRDNGSVASAWLEPDGDGIKVANGRGFAGAQWVELIDDTRELRGESGVLVKLAKVEGATLTVDSASDVPQWTTALVNPKVRRWDQEQRGDSILTDGAVPVVESDSTDPHWIDLEDGIQVKFRAGGEYRTGDYWLIPARVSTGDIEWPKIAGTAQVVEPHGIRHHYAPLGIVSWPNGVATVDPDCRCVFEPIASCFIPDPLLAGDSLMIHSKAAVSPAGIAKPTSKPASALPAARRAKVEKKSRRS